jgi:hypothetical protein
MFVGTLGQLANNLFSRETVSIEHEQCCDFSDAFTA